ncbi:MAG: tail fiber protein [Azospirillaceae bacterium]|nr:tail fiber protein [Azospirillaceae bacterium]
MSECFLGEIRIFAGPYVPQHWAACNGATVAISQNQALFALIVTTYGGNGVTNFNLPDYQGRTPIGQGQGLGLTNRTLGESGGTETVTLVQNNIPSHSHPFYASGVTATSATASGNMFAKNPSATVKGPYTTDVHGTIGQLYTTYIGSALGSTGGGALPHDNTMPFIALTYILAMQGIYPSRN